MADAQPTDAWKILFAALLAVGGGAGVKASVASGDTADRVGQLTEETRRMHSRLDQITDSLATTRADSATVVVRINELERRLDRLEARRK